MPLAGGSGGVAVPAGFELTLGPIGEHGQPRWRPSPPADPALVRSVLLASAALGPFVVLPWAVRSQMDADRLLSALRRTGGRPPATVAVPLVPLGFVADSARQVLRAGYRRAAVGEPSLHRSAVQRLGLGARDLVLLAPVPERAQRPWLRQMAALGLEETPTVARAVTSRTLLPELVACGVTYATGTVLARPAKTRLGLAGSPPGA